MQMKKSEVAELGPSRAMEIVPSTWRMPVTFVRSSGIGWKALRPVGLESRLNDGDADLVVRLIVGSHRPMESSEIRVEREIDVAKEVGGGDRGANRVHLDLDVSHRGPDEDVR